MEVEGTENTGARKLNNQQPTPSGCFSSLKFAVVSQNPRWKKKKKVRVLQRSC